MTIIPTMPYAIRLKGVKMIHSLCCKRIGLAICAVHAIALACLAQSPITAEQNVSGAAQVEAEKNTTETKKMATDASPKQTTQVIYIRQPGGAVRTTVKQGAAELGIPLSPIKNRNNVNDRQSAIPRAGNSIVPPATSGFTFILPGFVGSRFQDPLGISTRAQAVPAIAPSPATMPPATPRGPLMSTFMMFNPPARPMGSTVPTPASAPAPAPNQADAPAPESDTSKVPANAGLGATLANISADVRSDIIMDSTGLKTNSILPTGFSPATIPTPQSAFFGTNPRATVANPTIYSRLGADTQTVTDLGQIRFHTDVNIFANTNGNSTLQFRYLFIQFNRIVAGGTDSFFADIDCLPNQLDIAGPNSQVFLQHPVLGYIIPFIENEQTSFSLGVSLEQPETSATRSAILNGPDDRNYSHLPDFAAKLRIADATLGHVQLAGLARDLAVEGATNGFRADTFGWGGHFSVGGHPFLFCECLKNDTASFAVKYGEGIGNYILDTRVFGGTDAVVLANGNLKALPLFAYYAAYTHQWSDYLRSSLVYSQVDLMSSSTADPAFYRHGRYSAVNLIYQHPVSLPNDKEDAHHIFVAGIEYLYGELGTLGNGLGRDHRGQMTLGIKY